MAFLGEKLGCFHDGQVAINTNASQQEDAAVKCGFLQAWNQFAHKCAEGGKKRITFTRVTVIE